MKLIGIELVFHTHDLFLIRCLGTIILRLHKFYKLWNCEPVLIVSFAIVGGVIFLFFSLFLLAFFPSYFPFL